MNNEENLEMWSRNETWKWRKYQWIIINEKWNLSKKKKMAMKNNWRKLKMNEIIEESILSNINELKIVKIKAKWKTLAMK